MSQGERLLKIYNYMYDNRIVRNKTDFSEHFNIDYPHLNEFFKNKRVFDIEANYGKLEKIGISIKWFITGEGEMLSNKNNSFDNNGVQIINGINTGKIENNVDLNKDNFNLQKNKFSISKDEINLTDKDIIKVPILEIQASAGYGIEGIDNPVIVEYLPIPKKDLTYTQNINAIEISGDSMLPTFKSGDLVIFAKRIITSDGLYIINRDGKIYFKKLQFMRDNKVLIKSLNPDYVSEEINLNEDADYFGIIGRVFKHISFNEV